MEDITFKGSQRVLLIQGKGRVDKDDFVILTDKTFEPIRRYLDTRGRFLAVNLYLFQILITAKVID